MRRRRRNNETAKKIVIGVVSAVIVVEIGFAAWKLIPKLNVGKKSASDNSVVITDKSDDPASHPYITEVKYEGPVKYMELYDYPFGKSDNYKMNKDIALGTDIAAEQAKAFVDDIFTMNYRDIVSNPEVAINKLSSYADTDSYFVAALPGLLEDAGETTDDTMEAFEDAYIESERSTEAEFITNPSLVFEDGYLYCRGVIELTTYGNDSDGSLRCIPAEVMMKQDEDGFKIMGIMPVDGYAEFVG